MLETGCVSLAVSSKCWLQGLLAVRVCEMWDLQDAPGLPTIRWYMLIIGYIVAAGSSHMSAVLASSLSGQNGLLNASPLSAGSVHRALCAKARAIEGE